MSRIRGSRYGIEDRGQGTHGGEELDVAVFLDSAFECFSGVRRYAMESGPLDFKSAAMPALSRVS